MYNVITTAKYQNETISVVLDFSDLLKRGETVSTCTFIVTVLTGTDPSPSAILYQTYVPTGTKVDQKFRLGVPGVIYEITWQVVGSLGTTVEKTTPLAILPTDGTAFPVITFIYLTSFQYPYNLTDGISGFMLPYRGRDFSYLPEGLNNIMMPARGSIYGSSVSYNNYAPEGINGLAIMPSEGSIWGSSISYSNYAAEGVNGFLAPVVGSLYGSSLSYNNYATEGINSALLPTSGTIS